MSWAHEPGGWQLARPWAGSSGRVGTLGQADLPALHGGALFPLPPGVLQQTDEHPCHAAVRLRRDKRGLGMLLLMGKSLPHTYPPPVLFSDPGLGVHSPSRWGGGSGLQSSLWDLGPQFHVCPYPLCSLWQVAVQPWALTFKSADRAGPADVAKRHMCSSL